MRFDGHQVVASGEGWVEVEQPDGIARLVGYNEALIEVEPGETHPATARTNETTIRDRATNALAANAADIATNDTFLAIASPTNAQLAGQVKELTRQSTLQARELNALVRLVLRRFEGTD